MKWLVVRSDGMIPSHPVFVLDGHNPASAPAMFKFAHASRHFQHPDLQGLFDLANKMRHVAGDQPPPLTKEEVMILEAMETPGGKVKLYELNRRPHS